MKTCSQKHCKKERMQVLCLPGRCYPLIFLEIRSDIFITKQPATSRASSQHR